MGAARRLRTSQLTQAQSHSYTIVGRRKPDVSEQTAASAVEVLGKGAVRAADRLQGRLEPLQRPARRAAAGVGGKARGEGPGPFAKVLEVEELGAERPGFRLHPRLVLPHSERRLKTATA